MKMKSKFLRLLWRKMVSHEDISMLLLCKHLLPETERSFLEFILSHNNIKSRSQLYQDFLPLFFLGMKRNGFFVEVGVGDGINNSNSYLLEQEFGYAGILIEPNISFFSSLKSHRNSLILNCAAGRVDAIETTLQVTENGEYSHIENAFALRGVRSKPMLNQRITIKSLNSILSESEAPNIIDFLSIDVEGFELEVLQGLDLDVWKFRIICIEHNFNHVKKREIHRILESSGYVNVMPYASQFDSFFILL